VLQASPSLLSGLIAAAQDASQELAPQHEVLQTLSAHCFADVRAVAGVCITLLDPETQPDAAAAFASSTARPAVLLPWLRTVAQALLVLPVTFERPRQGELKAMSNDLIGIC